MAIDLNADMGESFGNYRLGCDDQIIRHITSANLACGFHASDPLVMDASLRLCQRFGVAAGAHPGYPDLRGFGRREMNASDQEIRSDVIYQVGALTGLAKAVGMGLQHVKPHGALYNTAARNPEVARAVVQAVAELDKDLILVTLAGPGGEVFRTEAKEQGLRVADEAFADRAYTSEGHLVPRGRPGAVIHDPAEVAARCLRMAKEGVVVSIEGREVALTPHTICVHGDTPSAVELVKNIRRVMAEEGVEVLPLTRIV